MSSILTTPYFNNGEKQLFCVQRFEESLLGTPDCLLNKGSQKHPIRNTVTSGQEVYQTLSNTGCDFLPSFFAALFPVTYPPVPKSFLSVIQGNGELESKGCSNRQEGHRDFGLGKLQSHSTGEEASKVSAKAIIIYW